MVNEKVELMQHIIKKLTCLVLVTLLVSPVFAQWRKKSNDEEIPQPKEIARIVSALNNPQVDSGFFMYSLPRTVFRINVEIERTEFQSGPYAAYANKYLGITDAKTDSRTTYSIGDITVNAMTEADPRQAYVVQPLHPSIKFDFLKMTKEGLMFSTTNLTQTTSSIGFAENNWGFVQYPDMGIESTYKETKTPIAPDTSKMKKDGENEPEYTVTITAKSLEDKAQEAAKLLLQLRKRRFELITGDIDAVFNSNEALKVALDEMRYIEQQYLWLFTGKTKKQKTSYSFDIAPTGVIDMYTLFKFSEDRGLQNADGAGRSIMLELQPEDKYANVKTSVGKDEYSFVYRIPDIATLRILDGKEELYKGRFYVYQNGKLVNIRVENFLAE